jgi:hypothetical protein
MPKTQAKHSGKRKKPAPPSSSDESAVESETGKKRKGKSSCCLNVEEEKQMCDFLQDNPILWDIKLTDYRRIDKKSRLWEELHNNSVSLGCSSFISLDTCHPKHVE